MMERLTIDDVIEHCKRTTEKYENLNGINALETADISLSFIKEYWEHRQVKEYLEELKCYKNDNDFSDYADRLHKIAFNSGYNKALDDFVNTVKATFPHDNIAICNTEVIAEQLKESD